MESKRQEKEEEKVSPHVHIQTCTPAHMYADMKKSAYQALRTVGLHLFAPWCVSAQKTGSRDDQTLKVIAPHVCQSGLVPPSFTATQ